MKKYGYCRISTPKQNIERQVRNIKELYGDAIIVKEVFTGTKFQGRKELDKIIEHVKEGDQIIFDSVSRMSRNADEGCDLYEYLFHKGVEMIFLKEPHVNSEIYREAIEKQIAVEANTGNRATDRLLSTIIRALNEYSVELAKQQIRIAFEQSEKEVTDLKQRTREGIETARLSGKVIGRQPGRKIVTSKSIQAKEIIKKHNKTFGGTLTNKETWVLAGITKTSFYKYKNELLNSL